MNEIAPRSRCPSTLPNRNWATILLCCRFVAGESLGVHMSRELDDVTHAFAVLLDKIKLLNNPDLEAAVVKAVDCLIMALGGPEHRITP
jgi:hypothetical protein